MWKFPRYIPKAPYNESFRINSCFVSGNVNLCGLPSTPRDEHRAFNKSRAAKFLATGTKFPKTQNFWLLMGPPLEILNELDNKHHIGCEKLAKRIRKLKIKYHVFGHIHNNYGIVRTKSTIFINSASLDEKYRSINTPLITNHIQS